MAKRRSPPLFEVMRETGKRIGMGQPPPAPAHPTMPGRSGGAGSAPIRTGPVVVSAAPSLPRSQVEARRPLPDVLEAPPSDTEGGHSGRVSMSSSVLWAAGGALVLVLVLTWVIAYQMGTKNEKNRLLGRTDQPPPPISPEAGGDGGGSGGGGRGADEKLAHQVPSAPPSPPASGSGIVGSKPAPGAPAPGIDDDPRIDGINYLVIATLRREDAERAATFLTESGVSSAVVAPESKNAAKIMQDPRAMWCVIAREGLTSAEYRASTQRRTDLENKVKQIGVRWKADQKGVANFADCGWNKYDGR